MHKPKIITISGPTGTGKTELAVKIARKYSGEVVSADSRYIYKELDICGAKPTFEEKDGIVHHLIDICDVTTVFTAGQWAQRAENICNDLIRKNKLPIVTGGTGLYLRTLYGEFDIPKVPPDNDLREKLKKLSSRELYDLLCEKDIICAKKIHPNNTVKVIRALEVILKTGRKMSEIQASKEPPFDFLKIILTVKNRNFLYEKVDYRVDKMVACGLKDEAEKLFVKYGKNDILMNTIGCKEFRAYFYGNQTLHETINLIKLNTRHYVKRQISLFSKEKNAVFINIDENSADEVFNTVCDLYECCV